MNTALLFSEKVISRKTAFLFIALTLFFLLLFLWRMVAPGLDLLAYVFLSFSVIFLFYSINYRTLVIRLTAGSLTLSFGIFSWKVPLDNVCEIREDLDLPLLAKYGGAGIHFMFVQGRYRACFNFLEHARLVIRLRRKAGLVKELSFSTRHPDEIIRLVHAALPAGKDAASCV